VDYDRLVAKHKDAVYRQMIRVCGNHDDAEDALIEALLSAYKSLDSLRDEAAFRGWLAQIGRRVCMRIRRKDALAPVMQFSEMELKGIPEPVADALSPDERVARDDLHGCVAKAMDQLPDIYREVYMLREIKGIPAPEVGAKLGLSIPALKSRLHRARQIMRELLDSNFCTALAA
jgi:RNA polymerase sigma-70 factor (ECF subfamily)